MVSCSVSIARMTRPRLAEILLVIFMLGTGSQLHAQGFMVQPMKLDLSIEANQSISVPLTIRNTAGSAVRAIDLSLANLSQNPDGTWRLVEEEKMDASTIRYPDWIALEKSQAVIEPLEPAEVLIRLDVPANARGAYFAAVIVQTPAPEDTQGLVVRMRFVIPVIIQISGRPVRQEVSLADAAMSFINGSDGREKTTLTTISVTNAGRTYSRIHGAVSLDISQDARWRPVARLTLPEKSIIPGMTLNLVQDLERRLPSGAYRLRADLYVDGRRIAPLQKEIDFTGDPTSQGLPLDTPFILEPQSVRMEIVPGATRTTTLRVTNPGDDVVKVTLEALTPKTLSGMSLGDIRGDEMSAQPWIQVRPESFVSRPGVAQNILVMSRVPNAGVLHSNYYADLVMTGQYEDGQSAGTTHSLLQLSNHSVESIRSGVISELSLAEGDEPGAYYAEVRMMNSGDVHVEPAGRIFLVTAQGRQVRNETLAGADSALLPLGVRDFGAEMNLSGLAEGYYALRASFTLGGLADAEVRRQEILHIIPDGEDITVEIVDPEKVRFVDALADEAAAGDIVEKE